MSGGYTIGRLRGEFCIIWSDPTTAAGRRRYALGTADRAAAEAKAREFWRRKTLGEADTIGQIVEAYLATIQGERSEERKRNAWKAAQPFWGGLRLSHIDKQTSATYMAQRKRAANTIRNELGLIRKALSWAVEERIIDASQRPPIKLPPMPESSVEHLTKVQFRQFLSSCVAPHVKLFAQIAVLTGARASAILELQWSQVDFRRRIIDLNPRGRIQTANKRRATVPMNERLHALLLEAKAGALTDYVIEQGNQPIKSIKKGIAAAAARSRIHCTPHMFRHSAAVWMAEARTPMSEIAQFLGHKDSRITEKVYARFHPDYLQEAAKALEW